MDAPSSTTEAVAAQAQSRGEAQLGDAGIDRGDSDARAQGNRNRTYETGNGIASSPLAPYERRKGDPIYRKLQIYTVDPSTPRLEGAVALVDVPYEPGPVGNLFCVQDYDADRQALYRRADLDDKGVLLRSGYAPSQSDPRFHQQMVYAVCSNVYAGFRKALGRQLTWRPGTKRLVVQPHARDERNAYYDEEAGALSFGYFKADPNSSDTTLPGGYVFTCLSHDIIAHEVTHALLDGLRAQFARPTGPDVPAFHEAFADLIALFQRFSYTEVVRNAIRREQGDISKANYLSDLARQFGHTTGNKRALRSAIDIEYDDWGADAAVQRNP